MEHYSSWAQSESKVTSTQQIHEERLGHRQIPFPLMIATIALRKATEVI